VAVTQALAKKGRVLVANPVLVLGVAVVPMVGLLQGRFQAYLGSVKLWDMAGALPLLLRKGFSVTVRVGDEIRPVTAEVEQTTYHLQAGDAKRWALRSDMLICYPGDEGKYRAAFTSGE
jgi:fructose-1,6-bisphosphatase/inositol monophosphatase family enzyme